MKKLLMLFLLIFPLLIFAIVNLAATVISYYLTLPVESVETVEGSYIHTTNLEEDNNFSFRILPTEARNLAFNIYNDEDVLLVTYDGKSTPQIKVVEESSVISLSINPETGYYNNGIFTFNVTTKNFGLTQLTVVTEDGKYEAKSDIFVQSPSDDPSVIQGVVFDYQSRHSNFEFGTSNNLLVYYTYFPKNAQNVVDPNLENQINNNLQNNARNLKFSFTNNLNIISNEVTENGRGLLTIKLNNNGISNLSTEDLIKNASFNFNSKVGYNIYTEEQIKQYGSYNNTYLQKEVILSTWLVLSNVSINGNGFKINHTNLPYYDELNQSGNMAHVGSYAVEIKSNAKLENISFIGPLTKAHVPYENISNLLLRADLDSNPVNAFVVKNVTIENGRFNISLLGKAVSVNQSSDTPAKFVLDGLNLIGSAFSAIEVNNSREGGTFINSSIVELSNIKISYTAVGVLIQNVGTQKGYSIINFISKENNPSIISDSWRNLDDASGALNMNNFGHILQELKSYTDVIYKDGEDYYVNPLIMLRGGLPNYSEIYFTYDEDLFNTLIIKERRPNLVESSHPQIGGTAPFYVYLVDPVYYSSNNS